MLLAPALDNPGVTGVQFVLAPGEQGRWQSAILSKVSQGHRAAKLRTPRWVELEENISFILAQNQGGNVEAHVSFWGEPFMARRRGQDIPRYVLHVQEQSPLINGLIELERSYRGKAAGPH